MKYSANKNKDTRSALEEEFHRVIIEGPGQKEIPPFELSPKVKQAIQNAVPQEVVPAVPRTSVLQLPQPLFRLRTGIAFACAILLVGVALFVFYQSGRVQVGSFQGYQVVWLEKSAAFNPEDLNIPATPALRDGHPDEEGLLRYQLGFLTADLAEALRKSLKSRNWEGVRQALMAQEMELPIQPPKHLAISDALVELLKTDVRDVELWVIQPSASVLLFTIIAK